MTKLLAALIAATFATGAVYANADKKGDAKPAAKKEDKKPAEAAKK